MNAFSSWLSLFDLTLDWEILPGHGVAHYPAEQHVRELGDELRFGQTTRSIPAMDPVQRAEQRAPGDRGVDRLAQDAGAPPILDQSLHARRVLALAVRDSR